MFGLVGEKKLWARASWGKASGNVRAFRTRYALSIELTLAVRVLSFTTECESVRHVSRKRFYL